MNIAADGLRKLPRDFYDRDAVILAQALIGKLLVHHDGDDARIGRIVEVEAYLGPGDLAAHTARGPTPRTRAMFGPPGHAYVYLVYGMHHCMNVVAGPEGSGTAVLLRALEPVTALPCATNGPGRLCKALGIDPDVALPSFDLEAAEEFCAELLKASKDGFYVKMKQRSFTANDGELVTVHEVDRYLTPDEAQGASASSSNGASSEGDGEAPARRRRGNNAVAQA